MAVVEECVLALVSRNLVFHWNLVMPEKKIKESTMIPSQQNPDVQMSLDLMGRCCTCSTLPLVHIYSLVWRISLYFIK